MRPAEVAWRVCAVVLGALQMWPIKPGRQVLLLFSDVKHSPLSAGACIFISRKCFFSEESRGTDILFKKKKKKATSLSVKGKEWWIYWHI